MGPSLKNMRISSIILKIIYGNIDNGYLNCKE